MMYPFGDYLVQKPTGTKHKIPAHSMGSLGPLDVVKRGEKNEPLELGFGPAKVRAGWKVLEGPKQ